MSQPRQAWRHPEFPGALWLLAVLCLGIATAGLFAVTPASSAASHGQQDQPNNSPPAAPRPQSPPPGAPPPSPVATQSASKTSPQNASPPAAQNSLTVDWKLGKLGVHAEKAPLANVLKKVASVTGTEIQGLEKVQGQVTLNFSDVSLADGLQRLLPDYDFALTQGDPAAPDAAPAHLIILESMAARSQKAVAANTDQSAADEEAPDNKDPAAASEEQAGKLEAVQAAATNQDLATLRQYIQDADPVVQSAAADALSPIDPGAAVDALLAATKSAKPTVVQGALTLLNQQDTADDQTVLNALGDALNNRSVAVRTYAVEALASRGRDAVDSLLRALKDSNPSVRMAVVQGAAQNDWGVPVLREALKDQDESVRKQAAVFLQHAPPPESPQDPGSQD